MRLYTFIILCCIYQSNGLIYNSSGTVVKPTQFCRNNWTLFETFCYYFSNHTHIFTDAQRTCHNFGGILAEPRTRLSIDFLINSAKEHVKANLTEEGYWIGGKRNSENETRWVWSSNNDEITETQWGLRQPSAPRQKCLQLKNRHFKWNDARCTRYFNYICQRPAWSSTVKMTVGEDDTLILHCPVDSRLIHYILWVRFSEGTTKPLSTSTKFFNATSSTLVISKTKWYDSGVYECKAASNIGNMTYRFVLNVNANSGYCPCSCNYRHKLLYWAEQKITNSTQEELVGFLQPILNRLENDLKIPKQILSSSKRRKTSAPDDRKSSQSIGAIAAAVTVSVLLVVFCFDIINFARFFSKLFTKNKSYIKHSRSRNKVGIYSGDMISTL